MVRGRRTENTPETCWARWGFGDAELFVPKVDKTVPSGERE